MPFSLSGSMQVEAVVYVCEISVGYSDSRAEGLSLVTFLQLYCVAPHSTSRRPFCFCSPTRKNERERGVVVYLKRVNKRSLNKSLNYDLGARETSRQTEKTDNKTWMGDCFNVDVFLSHI